MEKKLGEKVSFLFIVVSSVALFIASGIFKNKGTFLIIVAMYTVGKYRGVIIDNYINHQIDSRSRATVISIQSFANSIAVTLSVVFIGHLADLYSIDVVLIGMGALLGVLSIPFLVIRYLNNITIKKSRQL